jgi:hypothetical protein
VGIPIDERRARRPAGVYGGRGADVEDEAFICVPVGGRTSSGACIILRGMVFGLLVVANGIASCIFPLLLPCSPRVRCLTMSSLKPRFVQLIQSGEGKEGETEKEGIGIEPGNSIRRSAHRNPA